MIGRRGRIRREGRERLGRKGTECQGAAEFAFGGIRFENGQTDERDLRCET